MTASNNYVQTGLTHVEVDATAGSTRVRVAQARGWADTSAAGKTDISVIGNLNSEGRNVKRFISGSVENGLTMTAFYDKSDANQQLLKPGFKAHAFYIVHDDVDLIKYNDTEVLSRNKNGQEIDGLVGMDLAITVNGETEDLLITSAAS